MRLWMAKRRDRPFDYVAIINHRPVHHRPSCRPGERETGRRIWRIRATTTTKNVSNFNTWLLPIAIAPLSLPVALHSPLHLLNCPFNPFGFSVGCCRILYQNGERLLWTAPGCAYNWYNLPAPLSCDRILMSLRKSTRAGRWGGRGTTWFLKYETAH